MAAPKIERGYDAHEEREWRRVLVIAPPKVGKTYTTALTTCKNPKDVLMLLADEGGVDTLHKNSIAGDRTRFPLKGVYQATVDLLIQLRTKCPYRALVIDSGSMLQRRLKVEIMTTEKFTTQSGKEDQRKLYGKLLDQMTEIIFRVHDLPCHVVWTAWLREPYPDKMGGALMQGQSADLVEGSVGAILVLERVKNGSDWRYQIRTKPFFLNKISAETDHSGQMNANNRWGLTDPLPADLGALIEKSYSPPQLPKK